MAVVVVAVVEVLVGAQVVGLVVGPVVEPAVVLVGGEEEQRYQLVDLEHWYQLVDLEGWWLESCLPIAASWSCGVRGLKLWRCWRFLPW